MSAPLQFSRLFDLRKTTWLLAWNHAHLRRHAILVPYFSSLHFLPPILLSAKRLSLAPLSQQGAFAEPEICLKFQQEYPAVVELGKSTDDFSKELCYSALKRSQQICVFTNNIQLKQRTGQKCSRCKAAVRAPLQRLPVPLLDVRPAKQTATVLRHFLLAVHSLRSWMQRQQPLPRRC